MESKILTFNTGKAELCFVKVPEDAEDFDLEISIDCDLAQLNYLLLNDDEDSSFRGEHYIESIDIPISNWQIVGNPFELTEQESRCIVQEVDHPYDYQYIDYENPGRLYLTAQRSMRSLLDYLKIYQTNPYKHKPTFSYDFGEYGPTDSQLKGAQDDYEHKTEIWQQAQERTGSFIVLKKIV